LASFKKDSLPAGSGKNNSPKKNAIKTIIVDPGHGGSDVGAHGLRSYEKTICLAVGLKLGKLLEKEFPDLKILYTRTTDVYPEIRARADFANTNKGDLFVSIHVNSGPRTKHSKFAGYRKQVYYTGKGKNRRKRTRSVPRYTTFYTPNPSRGTETYIWAADRSASKGDFVTERLSEPVNEGKEFTPDLNDPVFKAQSLLWTKRYFDKSLLLANLVEEEFVKEGRASRGVKQRNEKGIWVLQATAMPSILVETGFISHKPDEDYLNSKRGQDEIAKNILNAIRKYRKATEGK
ncbi:MAG: N-acetylmuramoyl-L-alanine amidase, partial [Flavitalea sp.]